MQRRGVIGSCFNTDHLVILITLRYRSPTRAAPRSPRLNRLSRSPVFVREQTRQLDRNFDREVEMKVKVIESQLYEEKLKLQQKNDEEIQKVSWRWDGWLTGDGGIV